MEVVANPTQCEGRVHYLPHHAVVRQDKQTTRLRVVYDASVRADGPSLNDCLYTGPNFGQSTLDILLRFRLHNLGVTSPITVRLKLLFQQLCETKTDWDEPLTGGFLTGWKTLASDLQQFEPILLPRCYTGVESASIKSYSLQGFCDASQSAYAAVVYLRVESESGIFGKFLCSKTRVAPVKKLTTPRLELLSALLLYIGHHPEKTSETAVIFTWDNGVCLIGTEKGGLEVRRERHLLKECQQGFDLETLPLTSLA